MINSPFPRSVPRRPRETTARDWWFEALDNRCIEVGGERWWVQVLGIHTNGDDLWIQVARAGNLEYSIVLHVSPSVTVDDVVRVLRSRLADPSRRHVIHVTHAA